MKTLTFLALGILAGAGFMWRELRRAPLMPPDYDADRPPLNDGRADVSLPHRAEDSTDAAHRVRLLEKLRREEQRQRPQEGRN
jgi:hypothetical protein